VLRCRRVEDTKCGRRFHRLNVIGGLFCGFVVVLFCCEHSMCGVFFEGWFGNQFLSCVPVGVIIILDMASFHRKKKLAVVEWVGVGLLFLSVYLSDFNRVECRWANLKRVLSDLMFGCVTLQEAVYTHFGECNS